MVAIKVTSVGEVFLLDVMNELQAKGELSFEVDATKMVTSINGKENPADWSACWMLYTSDADFSNETYGTYDVSVTFTQPLTYVVVQMQANPYHSGLQGIDDYIGNERKTFEETVELP